jgi:bifunctional enzyme CysN/CysC
MTASAPPDRLSPAERERRLGHRGAIVWLTGLSGAGKTTLAAGLERILFDRGWRVALIDGDDLRHGLSADLGYDAASRAENIRRAGELTILLARQGFVVIAGFISPYREDRDRLRDRAGGLFHEIWLSADLATCRARDVKGLYARADRHEIANFTGVSQPYETPSHPDLVIDTAGLSVTQSLGRLVAYTDAALRVG